jgi:ribosomal protein L11 methyltransferase
MKMNYIKLSTHIIPYNTDASDVLIAMLGEKGYESFMETETGFDAYISESHFDATIFEELLLPFLNVSATYTTEIVPEQNWNEEWEKHYFQPIVVANKCVIRSPFHKDYPELPIQIVIEPKMSFGTGHHETTALMMEHILEQNMKEKRVLDMGCGTGILGILASIEGASDVTGIDIDKWCSDNSEENCILNNITNMKIELGDAILLKDSVPFDVIIANINRNILLEDIKAYASVLVPGGLMLLSGFYANDLNDIDECAKKAFLQLKTVKENNHWVAVAYEKGY